MMMTQSDVGDESIYSTQLNTRGRAEGVRVSVAVAANKKLMHVGIKKEAIWHILIK